MIGVFKIKLVAIFVIILFSVSGFTQNWQLVWSDEFDRPEINPFNWTRETGGSGWGNNEWEYYTNRDTNAFIEDGHLVIQALKEDFNGRNYTSARLKTQNKKYFKYGKIEASLKLPSGQGIWPAFWTMGQSITSVGWPACGEFDIMEMIGGDGRENTTYGTAHWDQGGHASYGGSYTLSSGTFSDDYHKFTMVWTEQYIKWYVDDQIHNTIDITLSGLSEFRENFFILLNLAVGGSWPGYPDSTTVFPKRYEIDYVRVYQDIPADVDDEKSQPKEFNLKQNYPNPFNPSTTINFTVPENSFVSLKVFNAAGSGIKTLADKFYEAGKHQVYFNASEYSSQVLFYQLIAHSKNDNFISTKKMILLK